MRYIFACLLLLTGCARTACEISIDTLQPAEKIPKVANIKIDELILADDGGSILLKNYSTMSHQIAAIKESCK